MISQTAFYGLVCHMLLRTAYSNDEDLIMDTVQNAVIRLMEKRENGFPRLEKADFFYYYY